MEFWVYLSAITPGVFRAWFQIHDGTNISTAEVRLDRITRTAHIVTPAGNILITDSCFNTVAYNVLTPVKLVVDMDTDRYVRLLIGPNEYDISAHQLLPGGGTTDKVIPVYFQLESTLGDQKYAWLDNFILTQNEP